MRRTLTTILAAGAIATGFAACGSTSSTPASHQQMQTPTQTFNQAKQDGQSRADKMIVLMQQAQSAFNENDYPSGCQDLQAALHHLPTLTADVNTLSSQGADVSALRQSETQLKGQLADLTNTCALGSQQ